MTIANPVDRAPTIDAASTSKQPGVTERPVDADRQHVVRLPRRRRRRPGVGLVQAFVVDRHVLVGVLDLDAVAGEDLVGRVEPPVHDDGNALA